MCIMLGIGAVHVRPISSSYLGRRFGGPDETSLFWGKCQFVSAWFLIEDRPCGVYYMVEILEQRKSLNFDIDYGLV